MRTGALPLLLCHAEQRKGLPVLNVNDSGRALLEGSL